jgi:hypothetical protein
LLTTPKRTPFTFSYHSHFSIQFNHYLYITHDLYCIEFFPQKTILYFLAIFSLKNTNSSSTKISWPFLVFRTQKDYCAKERLAFFGWLGRTRYCFSFLSRSFSRFRVFMCHFYKF